MKLFSKRMIEEGKWDTQEEEVESMWDKMTTKIKEVGQSIVGIYKNRRFSHRETWWWNEDVQKAIKAKQEKFKTWQRNKNDTNLQHYKLSKKATKKIISDAKHKAYDNLYDRLGTRQGEKDIFKLAKLR